MCDLRSQQIQAKRVPCAIAQFGPVWTAPYPVVGISARFAERFRRRGAPPVEI